jgi:hypothetical protein
VALRHRGGARLPARIEARAPHTPGHGAFNAKECGRLSTKSRQRQRHMVNLVESHRDIDLKTLWLVEKMICAKAAWKQPISFSSRRIAVSVTRKYV